MKILRTPDYCDRCSMRVAPLLELDENDINVFFMENDPLARIRLCRECLQEMADFLGSEPESEKGES